MTWSSQNSGKPENPRTEVHPNRSMETENLMGRMIKIVQDDISSLFAEHPLTFLNERDFVSEFHMGDLSGCLQRSRAVLAHPPRCRDGVLSGSVSLEFSIRGLPAWRVPLDGLKSWASSRA